MSDYIAVQLVTGDSLKRLERSLWALRRYQQRFEARAPVQEENQRSGDRQLCVWKVRKQGKELARTQNAVDKAPRCGGSLTKRKGFGKARPAYCPNGRIRLSAVKH